MKSYLYTLCALLCGATLAAAQTVSETTTTTTVPIEAAGTITTFDPTAQSLVVSAPGAAAVTYAYSPRTVIVDEAGNSVAVNAVQRGVPVKVYYSQVGERMVVSKMIVQQPSVQQTTTTTTTRKVDDD